MDCGAGRRPVAEFVAPSPWRPAPCTPSLILEAPDRGRPFSRRPSRRRRALRAFLGGPAPRRPRRARAQPARRRSRPAARQPDRLHRAVGFGEVEPGVRHDLRRGPAPVRRVVERVRPAVPRADGQAGRRLHRGPVAGGVDRPEVDEPQPALDRRHDHRGARLPAVALRPRRRAALPGLRARDREADPPADRGPGAGHAGGHPLPGAGSGGAHPQGRVRRPVRHAADAGLLPRAGRRHGAPAQRPADAEEAGEARHLGDRRPAVGQGERQAAPHRLGGDGPAPGRRAGRARLRRPPGRRPAPAAPVLRAHGVPERAPAHAGRPRAAHVLLQLALRRLPRVHRHRDQEGGRPGPGGPGPRAEPRRRRHRPVGGRPVRGVLRPAAGGSGLRRRVPDGRPVAPAVRGGAEGRAARDDGPGARPLPEPVRPRAVVLRELRRCHPVPRPPSGPDGLGVRAGEVRGLHARRAVPGLQGRTAQARGPGRDAGAPRAGRQVDRRGLGDVGGRLLGVPRRDAARRPPGRDRRAGAQGGPGPAGLPARRRPALPVAGPRGGHPVRWRGAADPAGHADRLRAGGRALRARRAVDRAAPARQPAADRDADAAARHGQHAHRRRARRRHDPRGRLGGRHRSGRGGARRAGGAQRHRRRPGVARHVTDGGLPVRPPVHPGPGAAPAGSTPSASSRSSGRASTTCAAWTSTSRWAASCRSRGCPGRASRR